MLYVSDTGCTLILSILKQITHYLVICFILLKTYIYIYKIKNDTLRQEACGYEAAISIYPNRQKRYSKTKRQTIDNCSWIQKIESSFSLKAQKLFSYILISCQGGTKWKYLLTDSFPL